MLDVFMAILFIFACCVEISKINVGYVNAHYSQRCQISRGEELSRWLGLLNWLLPQSRGPENAKRASCFYSPYSLDHLPGNDYKWIPRYLRIVSLPKVLTTKKAYTEVELKMGTWKKKKQLETISSV